MSAIEQDCLGTILFLPNERTFLLQDLFYKKTGDWGLEEKVHKSTLLHHECDKKNRLQKNQYFQRLLTHVWPCRITFPNFIVQEKNERFSMAILG